MIDLAGQPIGAQREPTSLVIENVKVGFDRDIGTRGTHPSGVVLGADAHVVERVFVAIAHATDVGDGAPGKDRHSVALGALF